MKTERHPHEPVESKPAGQELTRRGFLDRLLQLGIVTWIAGMVAPAVSYLWSAGGKGPAEGTVSAGSPKDIPVGGSKMIQASGRPVLVIRTSEETFRAFSAICTHLGCIVHWQTEKKQIFCPCHAGVFSADGKVVSGPPPRPLPEYTVVVTSEEVKIKL